MAAEESNPEGRYYQEGTNQGETRRTEALPQLPRCVGHNVDTLHLGFFCRPAEPLLQLLAERKRAAKALRGEGHRNGYAPVTLSGWEFTVADYSPRNYSYSLRHENLALLIAHGEADYPSIYAQLRSAWLWRVGPRVAARQVEELARTLGDGGAFVGFVSRLDMAADFTAFCPGEADFHNFVRRAKAWHPYFVGEGVTGFKFGSGDVQIVFYGKSAQIKTCPSDDWIKDVWTKHGWDGTSVWRAEVRLLREAINELLVIDPATGEVQGGIDGVLNSLDAIWSYAVGGRGQNGWLSCRIPGSATIPTRLKIDPRWEVVQNVNWGTDVSYKVVRDRRGKAERKQLFLQHLGLVVSIAEMDNARDFDRMFLALWEETRAHLFDPTRKGPTFAELVEARRQRRLSLDRKLAKLKLPTRRAALPEGDAAFAPEDDVPGGALDVQPLVPAPAAPTSSVPMPASVPAPTTAPPPPASHSPVTRGPFERPAIVPFVAIPEPYRPPAGWTPPPPPAPRPPPLGALPGLASNITRDFFQNGGAGLREGRS